MAYRQDLFLETIKQLRAGKTQDEASEKLNALVQACRSTGKAGTISLKITIKPDDGDTGQYFLQDKLSITKPEFKRGQTIMFGTPEGNLQRTDPSQGEFDLVDVSITKEPVIDVNGGQITANT